MSPIKPCATTFSIYYEPSSYSLKGKVMGRQAAGAGLMQAIADARPEKLWCYANSQAAAVTCAQTIAELGSPKTGIVWVPADQPQRLVEAGVLYRPDPGIGQHAWHRLSRAHPRAYSLCGIIQTISSHGPMSAFSDYLTAPVESWDAVICTSTAGRDAVRQVLEQTAESLRERVGATRFSLPQLPVIPLGVHTRKFIFSADDRAKARVQLGLANDEVAVLFSGRLIVHGKAHPLPMWLALEQAAQGRKVVLIQAGKAPSDEVLKIYTEEPKRFCPSVRIVVVDGGDFDLYHAAWAAADIFTSLSDNIQETFGITPVEAMASGLPVVVSDWNGYKDTIRHGIDGFRVPTLTLPPGAGGELADSYDLGVINFDYYSGYASQLVAVDIESTAEAFRQLIDDPSLRQRMGAEGAKRARDNFDWSIIFGRYQELWLELAERRRADPQLLPPPARRRRSDRPDPFAMFATYPTHHIGPGQAFRVRADISLAEALSRRELASTKFALAILPRHEMITEILEAIGQDWVSFLDLSERIDRGRASFLPSALVWLCKTGVLDFKPLRQ